MRIPSFLKLRKRNLAHHGNIPNRLGNPGKVKRALKIREKHLEQLSKKGFFDKLLKNRKKILIKVEGKPKEYTLLMAGIKNAHLMKFNSGQGRVKRNVAFLLDPLGRLRVFSKEPATPKYNEQWVELRGFSVEKGLDDAIACKEKVTYTSEVAELKEISQVLSKYQRKISFQDWPSNRIPYFMRYL